MPAGESARAKSAELLAEAARLTADAALWASGAEGEERVGAVLDAADRTSMRVLHDRLLSPEKSQANLDHVVVCPGGVFLVDTKTWTGNTTVYGGSLWQHFTNQHGPQHACKNAELHKVRGMAERMAKTARVPVTPVICLAGGGNAKFETDQSVLSVAVVPLDRLVPWLQSRPVVLSVERIPTLAVELSAFFPPAVGGAIYFGSAPAISEAAVHQPRTGRKRHHSKSRATKSNPRIKTLVATFLGLIVFATVGSRLLSSVGSAAGKLATNAAGSSTTPVAKSTLTAPQQQALADWAIRAGLYRDNARISVLSYVPDSGLGAYSGECKTQETTVAVYRKGLLSATDTQLLAAAKQYDAAAHAYLEACRKNEPVELHHAQAAMGVAANDVNIRYNHLIGRDPAAYNATHVL